MKWPLTSSEVKRNDTSNLKRSFQRSLLVVRSDDECPARRQCRRPQQTRVRLSLFLLSLKVS